MNNLKPCPFCGSEKVQLSRNIETLETNGIICVHCKMVTKFNVRKMLAHETFGQHDQLWIDKWNMRNGGPVNAYIFDRGNNVIDIECSGCGMHVYGGDREVPEVLGLKYCQYCGRELRLYE